MIEASDLQGGIVRGYGSGFRVARHLFARVRDPGAARAFLAGLADPVTTEQEWGSDRPATTLNVALSFRGLAALGIPDTTLDRFPEEFRCGMEHRAGRLGDHAPSWDDDLRALEVVLVVHAQSAEALDEEAGRRRSRGARALGARPRAACGVLDRRRAGCDG